MADPFGFLVATGGLRAGQAVADYWGEEDGWCSGVVTGLKLKEDDEPEVNEDGVHDTRWFTVEWADGDVEDMYEDHGEPNALQVLPVPRAGPVSCSHLLFPMVDPLPQQRGHQLVDTAADGCAAGDAAVQKLSSAPGAPLPLAACHRCRRQPSGRSGAHTHRQLVFMARLPPPPARAATRAGVPD